MYRYNIFNHIHKALRALLYHTALTLQQTDFTDDIDAEEVLKLVSDVTTLLDKNSDAKDKYILPAVEPFEPGIAATLNCDHYADVAISKCLASTIAYFRNTDSNEEKEAFGTKITNKFTELMMFRLKQMAKEEDVLNRILWNYYSNEQLLTIENTITENTSEETQTFVARWMMRGMNNAEIVKWMKSVEKNASCRVCQTLLEMAETELSEHRFRQVEASLTEGALVA
jgi:hypothetical protein